jgi:signal transduction histidine kinase
MPPASAKPFSADDTEAPGGDILVVDDVPANLVAMEAALESLGCRIVKATSGQEALKRILEQDFAVVLLDVQMPEMDGYETARWIRSRGRTKHLPIMFVTAHSHEDQAVLRAYKLGAVDFLFKPLHADVLRAKTQVFVSLAEAQKREQQRLFAQHEADVLRRQNEQLALADDRKNQFLALLAHELRNPLAPIRTSVDLMRRDAQKPAPAHLLDIMDRSLGHVTRIIDDLLDVARIDNGKIELRREALRVDDVVGDAVAMCLPSIDARGQTAIAHAGHTELVVHGDRTRLVQIVANLVSNASRYTPEGGRIEVTCGRIHDHAYVCVKDDGDGIAREQLDRVFELFAQEQPGSESKGGLGLGLALARRLAALHGGTLTAMSEGKGCGSNFELKLPLVPGAS